MLTAGSLGKIEQREELNVRGREILEEAPKYSFSNWRWIPLHKESPKGYVVPR